MLGIKMELDASQAKRDRTDSTVAASAADAPHGKRQAGNGGGSRKKDSKAGEAEAMRDLAIATAQLTLHNSQSLRAVTAITMDTIIAQADNKMFDKTKQATMNYAAATKTMKTPEDRQALGPPHIFVWQAILEHMKEEEGAAEMTTKIKGYLKQIEDMETVEKRVHHVAIKVKYCRVQTCYDSKYHKLQIALEPQSEEASLWDDMKKHLVKVYKASVKVGVAPRTGLERKVQDMIDKATV
eukprot:TRINITY_DN66558_c0_g1_i1.p2 TRINITY_DN66558_c0_g1~~TRINITY_DN66558_c0_g1_i1.p2  ORF type:complete len:240 (+),score=77.13 TRINITY_DN66558_c0_g1_i1:286-1005(+)